MWGELLVSIQNLNFYVISVLFLAFISSIIIFERIIMLQFVYNIDFVKFIHNLKKMVASEDIERAINFCKTVSKTSLPKIALKALEAAENDPTTIRGTIETDAIEMLPRLESKLNILPALATIVMLLGVLGTIDGLWGAFHSIEVLDTAKKQATLANGIATSLNPSAISLLVCTIILTCYYLIRGLALLVIEKIHYGVAVLLDLLAPPEVATTVIASAGSEAIAKVAVSEDNKSVPVSSSPTQSEESPAHDDTFDDAAVEDIKDEEEII